MWYIWKGKLFSHIKEWSTNICYHMGDSWKRCVKWNKANTKGQIPYDSIHLQCLVQLLSCVWFLLFSYKELCLSLWDPMDHSMPGFFLHHYLPEFAQTHVHWVSDTFQPSHPLSSPSLPAFNLSQHQGLLFFLFFLFSILKFPFISFFF